MPDDPGPPSPEEARQADAGDPGRVSFEQSLLPILIANDDRRYIDANPAACLLLRLPRVRVLQLRVDDLTPPENLDLMRSLWQEFITEGTQAGVYDLVMPDGQRVRASYSATANYRPGEHLSILDLQHDEPAADERSGVEGDALSAREREVLALVAMGKTSQSIALSLHVAVPTVETHIRNCLRKLGARNRPHAILLALRRHEISLY